MMRTIDECAEVLDVPREAADGLIKFLVATGGAKFRGERRTGNKGFGAKLYEITAQAEAALMDAVKRIR